MAVAVLLTGCEEFQPVFTVKYDTPQMARTYTDADFPEITPISQVCQMYIDNGSKPYDIVDECVIKGQVVSSDEQGNFYKSFYIQDETGGIEIKVGKNGLYNDYKIGQWVYVDCCNLTVGAYYGMIQIGYKDETGEYDTAYLEHQVLVDLHVFKGPMSSDSERIRPKVITPTEALTDRYLGSYVTIEGLKYSDKIHLLVYIDPNIVDEDEKKSNQNRFFLDDEDPDNWGITTWAMSETLFKWHVDNGTFDEVVMNDGVYVKERKDKIVPQPYTMNQYFDMPGLSGNAKWLQVRSSGYAKFSDVELPAPVLAGEETVTFTGILTEYDGERQFTLIDLGGVRKADGSPWYDENNKVIL